jgi:arylsulfatase B
MNGDANTGFWNVYIVEDGDYEIRLRRWPETADLPIDADLEPGAEVPGVRAYRTTPGKAISPTKASLQVGNVSATADVSPGMTEVVFNLKLKAGKTRMAGLFITADGTEYGSSYAYVKKK